MCSSDLDSVLSADPLLRVFGDNQVIFDDFVTFAELHSVAIWVFSHLSPPLHSGVCSDDKCIVHGMRSFGCVKPKLINGIFGYFVYFVYFVG